MQSVISVRRATLEISVEGSSGRLIEQAPSRAYSGMPKSWSAIRIMPCVERERRRYWPGRKRERSVGSYSARHVE